MDLTVSDIVNATGGEILSGSLNGPVSDICTDSRDVPERSLFVPIIGEHSDAHAFICQAFDKGAMAALTSEHAKPVPGYEDRAWIRVDDTKKALQAIGSYARDRISIPVIGVTGSVGKTTTRELTAAALAAKFRVFKTAGNHNSQIGVPITLTRISPDDEIAVLEMGISIPGEMQQIAAIARPDCAIITNISTVHIEQLGSKENILKEKLRIQDCFHPGSVLFVNGDDELLKNVKAEHGADTVTFGIGDNCGYRALDIELHGNGSDFTADCRGKKVHVSLSVAGMHNVTNAMAALAAADIFGVEPEDAAAGLSAFTGFRNRQRICEFNGITVIDDTYNASPESMRAALSVLCYREEAKRKIAVLGDMKELGPQSPRYHEEIGEWLGDHPVDILFTLGDMALYIEEAARQENGAREFYHFSEDERDDLTEKLREIIEPGDCVLLKGSNSMRLNEIAQELIPADCRS